MHRKNVAKNGRAEISFDSLQEIHEQQSITKKNHKSFKIVAELLAFLIT